MTRRRGFTIVDVIVGCALIALSLFFMLSGLPTAEQRLLAARNNSIATHLARAQMESARTTAFASLVSSSPAAVTVNNVVNGSAQSIVFTPTITVTSVSADLKSLSCKVTWKDRSSGPARSVVLETLIRNP